MKATKTSEYFAQYALIILGSVLFAAGFQFFLYPNSIIVGGVSAISAWPVEELVFSPSSVTETLMFCTPLPKFNVVISLGCKSNDHDVPSALMVAV